MAEQDFDEDLCALFDAAPRQADADLFAAKVDARIAQGQWLRVGLVVGLGLVGALIAWLQCGLSLQALNLTGVVDAATVAASGEGAYDTAIPWAAGLLLLGLGWLAVRPAISES
jgi:hypothetical protein